MPNAGMLGLVGFCRVRDTVAAMPGKESCLINGSTYLYLGVHTCLPHQAERFLRAGLYVSLM